MGPSKVVYTNKQATRDSAAYSYLTLCNRWNLNVDYIALEVVANS